MTFCLMAGGGLCGMDTALSGRYRRGSARLMSAVPRFVRTNPRVKGALHNILPSWAIAIASIWSPMGDGRLWWVSISKPAAAPDRTRGKEGTLISSSWSTSRGAPDIAVGDGAMGFGGPSRGLSRHDCAAPESSLGLRSNRASRSRNVWQHRATAPLTEDLLFLFWRAFQAQ